MCACLATTGITRATNALFQRLEGMFHPGLANLFEALGVICATAHPIKILRNHGVIGAWQREPIDWLVTIVTRVCSYCQTNLRPRAPHLGDIFDISNDNIRPRHKVRESWTHCMSQRRHHHRLRLTISNLCDLDRLHHGANGNRSGFRACIRRPAHRIGKLL